MHDYSIAAEAEAEATAVVVGLFVRSYGMHSDLLICFYVFLFYGNYTDKGTSHIFTFTNNCLS